MSYRRFLPIVWGTIFLLASFHSSAQKTKPGIIGYGGGFRGNIF